MELRLLLARLSSCATQNGHFAWSWEAGCLELGALVEQSSPINHCWFERSANSDETEGARQASNKARPARQALKVEMVRDRIRMPAILS
nr:hypothetical protein [Methylobacillus caricis]